MNENQLKILLSNIKDNEYMLLENENYFDIAKHMLYHIGSLDSKLRDNLIYATFYMWVDRNILSYDELTKLLYIALDSEYLFYKIKDIDDTSVFKRSFSVLIVALVLWKNNDIEFLLEKDIKYIYINLIKYMSDEKDLRGYVKSHGWADSRAHLADAISELVKSKHIKSEEILMILNHIKDLTSLSITGTVSNEGERFNAVITNILNKKLVSHIEFVDWINSYNNIKKEKDYSRLINSNMNIKSFLYPMYLRANKETNLSYLIEPLQTVLNKL